MLALRRGYNPREIAPLFESVMNGCNTGDGPVHSRARVTHDTEARAALDLAFMSVDDGALDAGVPHQEAPPSPHAAAPPQDDPGAPSIDRVVSRKSPSGSCAVRRLSLWHGG